MLSSAAEFLDKAQPRSVQLLQSSPPCSSHSTVNLYRQGNLDRFGGLHWQDSADYVLRILPANAWLECTLGVLRSTKGHASPMTLLNAAVKHLYWVTTLVIDAGRTAIVLPLAVYLHYVIREFTLFSGRNHVTLLSLY